MRAPFERQGVGHSELRTCCLAPATCASQKGLWLLTGAGQGIGRAFAHALGEAGAAVAVVDINGDKAEEVGSTCRACTRAHCADVSTVTVYNAKPIPGEG